MTDWGKLIRDLRIEQGISQRQLGLESGVNRSTLRRIEAGRANCTAAGMIEDLLAVLGYELDAIKVAGSSSAIEQVVDFSTLDRASIYQGSG